MFSDVKRTTWVVIAAVAVAASVLVTGAVAAFQYNLFTHMYVATEGLINDTLVANIHLLAFVVLGIMFFWGKLRPRDVGLRSEHFGTGLIMTVVLWLPAQVGVMLWQAIFGGPVGNGGAFDPNPLWQGATPAVVGLLAAQLVGNALYEEITFRGFFLPQLYLKLDRWQDRQALRISAAVALSVTMFALIHIPIRVWTGVSLVDMPGSLAWVALLGVLYSVIYLRTGNLFFTIGAHALSNAPTMLFVGDSSYAVMVVALLIAAAWPYAARAGVRQSRGQPLPSAATYGTKGV